jgi:hypothetical protein
MSANRSDWGNSAGLPSNPAEARAIFTNLTGSALLSADIFAVDVVLGSNLAGSDLFGGSGSARVILAQATTGTMSDVPRLPRPRAGTTGIERVPGGALRIGNAIWTASMLLNELQDRAERAQVESALSRFGLNRQVAADVMAARAYVWGRNIAPSVFWDIPYSGPVNERFAQMLMRHERDNPGTLGVSVRGHSGAQRAVRQLVAMAVAGTAPAVAQVFARTSAVDPALSSSSRQARTLLAILALQSWQAHHLIPFDEVARLPVDTQRVMVQSGWRLDSLENLIALPTNHPAYYGPPNLQSLPIHNTSHPRYSADVRAVLVPAMAAFSAASSSQWPAVRAAILAIENQFRLALVVNRAQYHVLLR